MEAARQRLAAARAQATSAAKNMAVADEMLEAAKKSHDAARSLVVSAGEEVTKAEKCLEECEGRDHGHTYEKCPDDRTRPHCVVCRLEEKWRRNARPPLKDSFGTSSRCQKNLVRCKVCGLYAHITAGPGTRNAVCDRKIFELEGLEGKSCFEIAHSPKCRGLWTIVSEGGVKKSYVAPSHPIYKTLRIAYGAPVPWTDARRATKRRKMAAKNNGDGSGSGDGSGGKGHTCAKVTTTRRHGGSEATGKNEAQEASPKTSRSATPVQPQHAAEDEGGGAACRPGEVT